MVGRLVTRDLTAGVDRSRHARHYQTAAKLVPIAGQAVSAGLSFTAMRSSASALRGTAGG